MASIEGRGSNWRVVWRFNGRKESVTFDDVALAMQAKNMVEEVNHDLDAAGLVDMLDRVFGTRRAEERRERRLSGDMTLNAFAVEWLERVKGDVGAGHHHRQREHLRRTILPQLGHLRLKEIRLVDIQDWLAVVRRLKGRGAPTINPQTVLRHHNTLHSMLQWAVDNELIPSNPASARRLRLRKTTKNQRNVPMNNGHVYLSHDEYKVLYRALQPDVQLMVDTLVLTGMRISEVTGLPIRALAVGPKSKRKQIYVAHAMKAQGDGTFEVGDTKNHQDRRVSISASLAARLAAHVEDRDPDEPVFLTPTGIRWEYSNFEHHRFAPAVAEARRCTEHPPPLPPKPRRGPRRGWRIDEVSTCSCESRLHVRPTIHDLRHTHAAWQIAAGRSSELIAARLGHSATVFQSVYAGILPQAEDLLADGFGADDDPQEEAA